MSYVANLIIKPVTLKHSSFRAGNTPKNYQGFQRAFTYVIITVNIYRIRN